MHTENYTGLWHATVLGNSSAPSRNARLLGSHSSDKHADNARLNGTRNTHTRINTPRPHSVERARTRACVCASNRRAVRNGGNFRKLCAVGRLLRKHAREQATAAWARPDAYTSISIYIYMASGRAVRGRFEEKRTRNGNISNARAL